MGVVINSGVQDIGFSDKFGLTGSQLYRTRLLVEKGSRAELNKFLTIYLPVVYLIARQYTVDSFLLEEYIKAGNLGLLAALGRVSSKADEITFYTSLTAEIRSALHAYIEQSHRVKRVPCLFLGKQTDGIKQRGVTVLFVMTMSNRQCPLRPRDVLLYVDGVVVNTLEDVDKMLTKLKKGDIFRATYSRDGVMQDALLNCE